MAHDASETAAHNVGAQAHEGAGLTGVTPLSVIIADESPSTSRKLAAQFASLSISVVCTASNGNDAAAAAAQFHPTLTLLAARIPPSGCIDAIRAILAGAPETQVFVTFNDGDDAAAIGAIDAGAAHVIDSAIGTKELAAVVAVLAQNQPDPLAAVGTGGTSLTTVERQVLVAIASGVPQADIPEILGITRTSVDAHVRNVLKKLHKQEKA